MSVVAALWFPSLKYENPLTGTLVFGHQMYDQYWFRYVIKLRYIMYVLDSSTHAPGAVLLYADCAYTLILYRDITNLSFGPFKRAYRISRFFLLWICCENRVVSRVTLIVERSRTILFLFWQQIVLESEKRRIVISILNDPYITHINSVRTCLLRTIYCYICATVLRCNMCVVNRQFTKNKGRRVHV